jgi:dCMP deaminase
MPKASGATKIFIAYVPVLHRGYLEFFDYFPTAKWIYVIGTELLAEVDYLRKDLRALDPEIATVAVAGLDRFDVIKVLEPADISELDSSRYEVIMPDDDISREIGKKFKKAKITFHPIFLRWDRRSVEANEIDPDEKVSSKKNDQKYITQAAEAAGASSDIWRRVGAILISKSGQTLGKASNQGEPTAHSPWMEGDPRNIFNRGVGIEMSLFIHAEASLIADAAKNGTKLEGASMYVTTFPCPACAKLIAHSGIKNIYYKDGYAVLDGKRVFEAYDVNVMRVSLPNPESQKPGPELVPYK